MQQAHVLVVGGGGREHALAWALARSPEVAQVYVAPGNAGTTWAAGEGLAAAENVPLAASDIADLIAFALEHQVALTVVGPEANLAAGIVDEFQAAGLPIFGPTRAATQLESSKAFAKDLMREQGIPTASYASFQRYEAARDYLAAQHASGPVVVKADGLAAGKGVIVCDNQEEAQAALRRIMVAREFGAAGDTAIIEEHLSGREVSLLAFSDGRAVVPLPPARDHKRVFEGDAGPNTGGMGAYAPVPDVGSPLIDELTRTVLRPAVAGMAARGTPYVGMLYAGLILTDQGPQVLEFNCRFGDPEAQALLPLLAPGASLFAILLACVEGQLDAVPVPWRDGTCATVVVAAPGYPGDYPRGLPISGLDQLPPGDDLIVFHAGTAHQDGQIVTAGGRVLAVSATGPTLAEALQRAYSGVAGICFEGMHYRRDIGQRDMPR
jgi:phosphoribosylamine--glycine ligase